MLDNSALYLLFVSPSGDVLVVDKGFGHRLPGGLINSDQTPESIIRKYCHLDRNISDYEHIITLEMRIGRRRVCRAMIYRLFLNADDVRFFKKVEWLNTSIVEKFLHDETLQLPKMHPVLRHALKAHLGAGP